jgi:hypothetical protein
MHNLAVTVLLAEQKRCQCPCGAIAERRSGLCRKCHDRNAWRRKAASPRRKATRRRFGRRSRTNSRLHAETTTGMEG